MLFAIWKAPANIPSASRATKNRSIIRATKRLEGFAGEDLALRRKACKIAALRAVVDRAFKILGAARVIEGARVGRLIGIKPTADLLVKLGIGQIHADTFHAKNGAVKYALGLVWLETLTGKSALENGFRDFGVPTTDEEVAIAQKAAHDACALYTLKEFRRSI